MKILLDQVIVENFGYVDGKTYVATYAEIFEIKYASVGMRVFCGADGKTYEVVETTDITVGPISYVVPKTVKEVSSSNINYRGEYILTNVPSDPKEGDWYRNSTYGKCYIYQNGVWVLMSQDGEKGDKGDKGEKGDPGIQGNDGTSINIKGTLTSEEDLELIQDPKEGDCYIIGGDLWVYTEQNGWINVGRFVGEPGVNSFLDIRYSNDIENKVFTGPTLEDGTNSGINTGVYIGIRVTTEEITAVPADFDKYQWSELMGTSTEIVYISVPEGVTPTRPVGSKDDALAQGWKDFLDEATQSGQVTWQSTAEKLNNEIISEWSAPIRITGESGIPGEDGSGIEFIFCLSTSNTISPTLDRSAVQLDQYVPSAEYGWTASAQGVSKDMPFEWVSTRTKTKLDEQMLWGVWSTPQVWSSYGVDGVDGGGAEYIFYQTKTYDSSEIVYKPTEWLNDSSYQSYDWIPTGDGWYDNPKGVNPNEICEWVSKRKYSPGEDGKPVFTEFSVPALWAKYATDGASTMVISLTNDNTFIPCNTDRKAYNPGNPPTTRISAYIGSQNITGLTTFEVECDNSSITDISVTRIDDTQVELNYTIPEDTVFEDKTIFTITGSYWSSEDVLYQGYKRFILTAITDPNYKYYEISTNSNVIKRDNEGNEYPQYVSVTVKKFTPDGVTDVTTSIEEEGLRIMYMLDSDSLKHLYVGGVDADRIENIIYFQLVDSAEESDIIDEESVEIIKDGTNGTNIEFTGSVETYLDLLEILSPNIGDTYYVSEEGCLYVWDGSTWVNVGEIKGEPGKSVYIHQKYAMGSSSDNLTWTENYGEKLPSGTTNSYLGWTAIWTDNILEDWWPTDEDGNKLSENDFVPGEYSDDPTIGRWLPITGLNGGKTIAIYTLSTDEPIVPSEKNINNFPIDGWTLVMPTGEKGKYIWQCTGTLLDGANDTTINGDWQGPSRISGLDGEPGADAEYDEFVYYLTDSRPTIDANGAYTNSPALEFDASDESYQKADYIPGDGKGGVWSDRPQGITFNNVCEWMSSRHKNSNGVWGDFSDPTPWSVYGETGADGDGIQYVFCRARYSWDEGTPSFSTIYNSSKPLTISTDDDYQNVEYIPEMAANWNSIVGDNLVGNWTDDSEGVTEEWPYVFVSTRKMKNGAWDKNGEPIPFTEPKLWSHFGADGADGEDGVDGAFKSTVFCRTEEYANPGTPTGGTYSKPVPSGWSDGIPETGGNYIWASSCTFYADNTSSGWTYPALMRDNQGYDVEFCPLEAYSGTPSDYDSQWFDPIIDTTPTYDGVTYDWSDMIWRAERKYTNDTWSNWVITRIKGEKGDQGDNGSSILRIDLGGDENVIVPCRADGSLIKGTHEGASEDGLNLTSYIYITVNVYYGSTDISTDTTTSYLLSNNSFGDMFFHGSDDTKNVFTWGGFNSIAEKSGNVTITANTAYGKISTVFRVTKSYSGADGVDGSDFTFEYYEVSLDVTQIVATYNEDSDLITSVDPGDISCKLAKYTLEGKELIDMTDQSTYMWSIRTYAEDILTNPKASVIKSATTSLTNMVDTLSVSSILTTDAKYLCVGIYTSSQISAIQSNGILGFTDYDIIPISFKYEGTIANLPDWLKEWNGDNAATIYGRNLAAISAYFGEKPDEKLTDWTGVLIGSKVASIEGLPWQNDGYAYDFSGILGVKNFDTNPGDNYVSSVTFALDASTGDAYFNGEVHATTGTFNNGTFETCTAKELNITDNSNIKNSTIEDCTINKLSITTDNYVMTLGDAENAYASRQAISIVTNEENVFPLVEIYGSTVGRHGVIKISENGYYGDDYAHFAGGNMTLVFGNPKVLNPSETDYAVKHTANISGYTVSLTNKFDYTNGAASATLTALTLVVPYLPKSAAGLAVGSLYAGDDGIVRIYR